MELQYLRSRVRTLARLAHSAYWRLVARHEQQAYQGDSLARINRVNINVTRPLPLAIRSTARQSYSRSAVTLFISNPSTTPIINLKHYCSIKNTPKCSHSLVKRLSSPHSLLSPAQALFHVFNSMLSGVCMLLEVVRMSSLVEVVLGDVRSS